MIIRREPKLETNYYVLDKRISEDDRLSWAARGLLIYLLGKPDHWEVSVQHLIKQTENAGKHSRRDAVYGLLKELEEAGYVRREQGRKHGGGFNPVGYVVSETPLTEKPEAVKSSTAGGPGNTAVPDNPDAPLTENPDAPLTGSPLPGLPYTANPTLVSNDLEQSTEEEQRAGARTEPTPPPAVESRQLQASPLSVDNDLIDGIREAWVDEWAGTTADTPILTSQTILGLQGAIARVERDNADLEPRTPDYWRSLFRHLAKSDFLAGRKPMGDGRPFRMRLHWLLREDNLAKCRAHEYCEPHHCGHVRPAAQVSR